MSMLMLRDVTDHHEKPLKGSAETNKKLKSHMASRLRDSNPGHSGWKRVLSRMRRPTCFRWSVVMRSDRFLRGVWGLCRHVFMCRIQSVWFVSPYTTYQMLVVIFRSSCELNPATIVNICRVQALKIRIIRFSLVETLSIGN